MKVYGTNAAQDSFEEALNEDELLTASTPDTVEDYDDLREPGEDEEASRSNKQLLEGFQILVLEDAPDTREVVRYFLEKTGAKVHTAESAQKAWEYLSHTVPTLIVSDIAMPGQDGISFIKELRTQTMSHLRGIPALALTAFNDRSVQHLALGSGFQDYLLKPISCGDLVAAVLKLSCPEGSVKH